MGVNLLKLNASEHNVRDAIIEYAIHQIEHPYKDSTDYDVIIDDRPYSPVAIMGIASSLTQGTKNIQCIEEKRVLHVSRNGKNWVLNLFRSELIKR